MQPSGNTLTAQQAALIALGGININYSGSSQALNDIGLSTGQGGDGTIGPNGQAAITALANSPLASQYQVLVSAAIAAVASGQ